MKIYNIFICLGHLPWPSSAWCAQGVLAAPYLFKTFKIFDAIFLLDLL
jgi:hypothetical protein